MFLIYNLSGLFVGLAGIIAFGAVVSVTGRNGIALLAASLVWIGLGFWWRNRPTGRPARNDYPSVFFIPLPFIGIGTVLLSLLAITVELKGGGSADPRSAKFDADEKQLREARSEGDVELSRQIRSAITDFDGSSDVNVFTRIEADRVLILAKVAKLSDVKEAARQKLLDQILKTVGEFPAAQGKTPYVGVKGRLLYGIVHVPPGTTKIGEAAPEELLYDFYGPAAQPSDGPSTAAAPVPTPVASSQPGLSSPSAPVGGTADSSLPAAS
jgi:hypothetical protein